MATDQGEPVLLNLTKPEPLADGDGRRSRRTRAGSRSRPRPRRCSRSMPTTAATSCASHGTSATAICRPRPGRRPAAHPLDHVIEDMLQHLGARLRARGGVPARRRRLRRLAPAGSSDAAWLSGAAWSVRPCAYKLVAWLSPAMLVGAYSYSHALEAAVEAGAVADVASLRPAPDRLRDGTGSTDGLCARDLGRRRWSVARRERCFFDASRARARSAAPASWRWKALPRARRC